MPYFDHPIETVEIPYAGTTMQGYFVPARVGTGRRPTILYLNGADSLSEEAYFTVALPASMAGYHCLVFNAPGVGLILYDKGLPTRPNCEHFVTPALDFLLKRPEVDTARVATVGESFAAYLIPRAAAYEPRLTAAASWGRSTRGAATTARARGSAPRAPITTSTASSGPPRPRSSTRCASSTRSRACSGGSRARSSSWWAPGTGRRWR
jgi:hypothetical protein